MVRLLRKAARGQAANKTGNLKGMEEGMEMRKVITTMAAALLVAGAFTASAQENGNPFRVRGDNGEIVKVLPPQASIHADKDPLPVDAVQSGFSVYPGSYGSGQLLNHGGKIIQTAKFLAVFYDSSIPANITSGINSFINTFIMAADNNEMIKLGILFSDTLFERLAGGTR